MYRDLNDDELIYMVKEDNDNYDIMLKKYQPLLINICMKYLSIAKKYSFEFDDLMQISRIALLKAINYYRDNQDTLFYTYLENVINIEIKNVLRNERVIKRKTLNGYISYDEFVPMSNNRYIDIIENPSAINPYEEYLFTEKEIAYRKFLNKLPIETSVAYELRNDGLSIEQISTFLNLSKLNVSKLIKNARQFAKVEFV